MPEIVNIVAADFDLIIWVKDIEASKEQLSRTMALRNKALPGSVIKFDPPLKQFGTDHVLECFRDHNPLFFENKQYDIEFVFNENLKSEFLTQPPYVIHRLKAIEDSFHYSQRSHSIRATINTANDLGWFRIELVYIIQKQEYHQVILFEVLPTKLDLYSDLKIINNHIDKHYPLWRFKLAEKTQYNFKAVKNYQHKFLLLWLAHFECLRKDFEKGLKYIIKSPHNQLVSYKSSVKIGRLKNKLNRKIEYSIKQANLMGLTHQHFYIDKKKLTVDTLENRFIKSILDISIKKLTSIHYHISNINNLYEKQKISDSFVETINNWTSSLKIFRKQAVFKKVGDFSGLKSESLVLQQKSGYSKVYKIWQKLKWYLEFLGNDSSLSLRNISELYEIWCFLSIKDILTEIGFSEKKRQRPRLLNEGINIIMEDNLAGSFIFERKDGVVIELIHEPFFSKNGNPVKTWTVPQKPDILLKVTFNNGSEIIWIFDAKYRVETNDGQDYVPEDAINQMHRYRDALIYQYNENCLTYKSRPVFGAFALYPGFYNQVETKNPYQEAIDEVGIGAFSLLPSEDNLNNFWLKQFLIDKIGEQNNNSISETEKIYIDESVRIPYKGTKISFYSDLVIAVGSVITGRDKEYIIKLRNGKACHYHMKLLATNRQQIEQHIIEEVRYLAIAVKGNNKYQEINYIYPIVNVICKKRVEITREQSGTKQVKNPHELYWLFSLGTSFQINSPIVKSDVRKFTVKLTSLQDLFSYNQWSELSNRYNKVYHI